ncbi:MAG: TonB family protein [Hyphomicrobiales bacterium]
MTAATLRLDEIECQKRTRWTMTASVVLHALLFLWIVSLKTATVEIPHLTEITMLTPGELEAAAAPAAPAAPGRTLAGIASRIFKQDVSFKRTDPRADLTVDPQSSTAFTDQMAARLAALTENQAPLVTGTATSNPASLFGSGPATVSGTGTAGSAPVSLNHGSALGGSGALPLTRGGGTGAPAGLAPASVPGSHAAAPAAADVGDATARRTIAGASLAGPIADRPVLQTVMPAYPEWAKKEAVEGSVTLYFVVRADGSVKENVVIQKTAGFGDFDENARTAIRAWKFKPLAAGRAGEQWGTITFHFRLTSAG